MWSPRKHKYIVKWNKNYNLVSENLIQQGDRNSENNSDWNEDGIEKQ